MYKNKKRKKGFTLIELIVVIAILAVLSAGAIIAYGNITSQARASAENADGYAVVRALNTYNALAGTPITALPDRSGLANLSLSTSATPTPDMIDMSLGINISAESLAAISGRISYAGGTWVYTPA